MDNVRGVYTEARRARNRFNDLLSVSSQARESVQRRAHVISHSVSQAEQEAAEDVRRVADYQHRVCSQVLGSDEQRELQPSPVSSWRLRSGMFPASLSRVVEGQNTSMDLWTRISMAKHTPSNASRDMDAHPMGVPEWGADVRNNPPPPPMEEPRATRRSPEPAR